LDHEVDWEKTKPSTPALYQETMEIRCTLQEPERQDPVRPGDRQSELQSVSIPTQCNVVLRYHSFLLFVLRLQSIFSVHLILELYA
jgi:hypothetical protein